MDLTSTLMNSSPAVGVPKRDFKEPNNSHVIKDSRYSIDRATGDLEVIEDWAGLQVTSAYPLVPGSQSTEDHCKFS